MVVAMPNAPQRGVYPKDADSVKGSQWEQAHRLYGSGDVDKLFGGAPKTLAPWPSAGRTKANPRGYDQGLVNEAVRNPHERLRDMDPRNLHATQPWVTREGVSYYSGSQYRETGQTFADMHEAGNRYPVVYTDVQGRNKLLSGHHRATSALIHGEQFRAIHIEE